MLGTDFLCEVASILQKGLGAEATFEAVFDLVEKTIPYNSATLAEYYTVHANLQTPVSID